MKYRCFLTFAGICWAAWCGSLLAGGAGRPGRTLPKNIVFMESQLPSRKFVYGEGTFRTSFSDGWCRLSDADFLLRRYGHQSGLGWGGKFFTGDVVGTLGGLFRANCWEKGAVLERIADKDLPRGVPVPAWDSLTVPLSGGGSFDRFGFDVTAISHKNQAEITAVLRINTITVGVPKKRPLRQAATVKAGDILLLGDKGYVVRAVVPADARTRVVGWVELSPAGIAEADLVRNKQAFVRPQPLKESDAKGSG